MLVQYKYMDVHCSIGHFWQRSSLLPKHTHTHSHYPPVAHPRSQSSLQHSPHLPRPQWHGQDACQPRRGGDDNQQQSDHIEQDGHSAPDSQASGGALQQPGR